MGVSLLAITLCILILTPGILADYYTARYLKPDRMGKDHANTHRWNDLVRRMAVSIQLKGKDDVPLQGWLFRPERPHHRLVFYLHDFSRDHRDGYDIVHELLKHGLHVFVLDLRAHGESSGNIGRSLRLHYEDIRLALNYLNRLLPKEWREPVAILGEGMGGSTALFTASQDGRFRIVVALQPPLDPETEVAEMMRGKPSLLLSLTQKRIERVGDLHYRHTSLIKNVQRLRDSFVMIVSSSQPHGKEDGKKQYTSFCGQTRGYCQTEWIQQPRLVFWWNALPSHQRDHILQFLLKQFQIPVLQYRLRLRPHPPLPSKTAHPSRQSPPLPRQSVISPRVRPIPQTFRPPAVLLQHPRRSPAILPQHPRLPTNRLVVPQLRPTPRVIPSSLPTPTPKIAPRSR